MLKERNSPLFHKAAGQSTCLENATIPSPTKRRQRTQQSLIPQSGVKERNNPFSYKAASKNATIPSPTKRRQRTQQSLFLQSGVKERNNPFSRKAAPAGASTTCALSPPQDDRHKPWKGRTSAGLRRSESPAQHPRPLIIRFQSACTCTACLPAIVTTILGPVAVSLFDFFFFFLATLTHRK